MMAIAICAAVPAVATPAAAAARSFVIFDGLLYLGKPDLRLRGLTSIAGSGDLWQPGESKDQIDQAQVQAVLRPYRHSGEVYYIDLENWPLMSVAPQVRQDSIAKLMRLADIAHREAPQLRVGFYGELPVIAYWPIMRHGKDYGEWLSINRELDQVASRVDVVFPSLYTFYDDLEGWKTYARETLKEARRYGKPVYAFLWPEFHDSNAILRGRYLPAAYWRAELELCYQLADGVVLWGGWQQHWNDTAPWWRETVSFMDAHALKPPTTGAPTDSTASPKN